MTARAPIVATLLALALGLGACGPSLMDEPTEFTGDETLSVGVLCSTDVASPGEQVWAKFAVRHADGVTPNWQAETLEINGGLIRRRAAGRDVKLDDGTWKRFETYWIEVPANARPGSTVEIGPLTVPYTQGRSLSRRHVSATCEARVE